MYFMWDDQGDYSFDNPEYHNMELIVNNEFFEREQFKQVHTSKGYDTLGLFIDLNVSQTYQLLEMKKKATSWADNI